MGVNENFNKDDHHECVDDDEIPLPGFRFHPTDEELVSFYLRRKLDKKPISIDLIKQIDIYKYDPWDLPSMFFFSTFFISSSSSVSLILSRKLSQNIMKTSIRRKTSIRNKIKL